MEMKKIMVVFALVLYLSYYSGKCQGRDLKLTSKEELEIEKELKLLNKPAVKTIQYFGDLYDCVDFYKQPSFDNPLLKNHKYEMSSESFPMTSDKNESSESWGYESAEAIGLPDGGCPTGTVPIRRTTKEDLINTRVRVNNDNKSFRSYSTTETGDIRAVRRTASNVKKYYGGKASISLYGLKLNSSPQSTQSLMALGNGLESIEVGWTEYFGGYSNITHSIPPRFYTYLKAGPLSCYNYCKGGFVQTNPIFPLGFMIRPVSTRGGSIYAYDFHIYRGDILGNWWVVAGKDKKEIGYYPKEIFSGGLKEYATYVEWGGAAKTAVGVRGPEMGSGYFPTGDISKDGFCLKIKTVNEVFQLEDPGLTKDPTDTHLISSLYRAVDYGLTVMYGQFIGFGGPGLTP